MFEGMCLNRIYRPEFHDQCSVSGDTAEKLLKMTSIQAKMLPGLATQVVTLHCPPAVPASPARATLANTIYNLHVKCEYSVIIKTLELDIIIWKM